MEFKEETRELTSSTGYLKRIATGEVYNSLWLGKYDKPGNYEEATKEEYEEYQKSIDPEMGEEAREDGLQRDTD
jgi:hypothetical protein